MIFLAKIPQTKSCSGPAFEQSEFTSWIVALSNLVALATLVCFVRWSLNVQGAFGRAATAAAVVKEVFIYDNTIPTPKLPAADALAGAVPKARAIATKTKSLVMLTVCN